jgi:hypothetical protein
VDDMGAPVARTGTRTGFANTIVFTGKNTVKESMKDFGLFFETEVEDDTIHAMIVDPRFRMNDLLNYIVELGGVVYTEPPES